MELRKERIDGAVWRRHGERRCCIARHSDVQSRTSGISSPCLAILLFVLDERVEEHLRDVSNERRSAMRTKSNGSMAGHRDDWPPHVRRCATDLLAAILTVRELSENPRRQAPKRAKRGELKRRDL